MSSDSDDIVVLYVDDDAALTDRTSAALEDRRDSFEVVVERSVGEGLNRLAETAIDCVVSEYHLPDQNGLDFLDAVRERHGDRPFILYTAHGSE